MCGFPENCGLAIAAAPQGCNKDIKISAYVLGGAGFLGFARGLTGS
jgi:hypothetical protein